MINYQYQVLRFLPDRVNEEFVNLGVVLFDQENRQLKSRFSDKAGRVALLFPETNTRYLNSTLQFLRGEFFRLSDKLSHELPLENVKDISEITKSILPVDDSSLIFSEIRMGRDVSLDGACEDLYERVVIRNVSEVDEIEIRKDREVWNKVYKTYFENQGVSNHLHPHTVRTSNDHLQFDRAWKNGKWNCFETVSFNLSKAESVKNKVYKWAGKLAELSSSKEPIDLYLLSVLPENDELKKFIRKKLNNIENSHSKVKLVTEEDAEALAKKFKREIAAHDHN
ncbi:MAG: DUF3037 domain-containing protein [Bacteroidota bacterium]